MLAPSVAVIVPCLQAEEYLPDLLTALMTGDTCPDEIIVVDDGSSDRTRLMAELAGCRVLATPTPRSGPAVGRNLGALHASSQILFFLDADVVPHADAVTRVRAHFQKDPSLDAVFGSYDDSPTDPHFLSQYKNLFHHYVHQNGSDVAGTFWTGCGAIQCRRFMQLGGFTDEYTRPCIEDIELGYRLSQQGGRIHLDKELLVTHRKRWTGRQLLRTDIWDRGVPWTELILRHRAFVNDLNLQTRNRWSVVLVWLLLLSLVLAVIDGRFLILSGLLGMVLIALNWKLYTWFARKRGRWFSLRVIPWHWLYYAYNAISFAIGAWRYSRSAFAAGDLHPSRPGALKTRIEG